TQALEPKYSYSGCDLHPPYFPPPACQQPHQFDFCPETQSQLNWTHEFQQPISRLLWAHSSGHNLPAAAHETAPPLSCRAHHSARPPPHAEPPPSNIEYFFPDFQTDNLSGSLLAQSRCRSSSSSRRICLSCINNIPTNSRRNLSRSAAA
uniref:Ovule protein n=1 Tax=Macrostomum lignano TaxID=282301 RepID=A0A1I8F842_9PLAT